MLKPKLEKFQHYNLNLKLEMNKHFHLLDIIKKLNKIGEYNVKDKNTARDMIVLAIMLNTSKSREEVIKNLRKLYVGTLLDTCREK